MDAKNAYEMISLLIKTELLNILLYLPLIVSDETEKKHKIAKTNFFISISVETFIRIQSYTTIQIEIELEIQNITGVSIEIGGLFISLVVNTISQRQFEIESFLRMTLLCSKYRKNHIHHHQRSLLRDNFCLFLIVI